MVRTKLVDVTVFLVMVLSLKLLYVVYFDQLLGAEHTRKLVETFFKAVFQTFLFISKIFQ